MSELINGPLHRVNSCRRERLGNIADSTADEPFRAIGIGFAKIPDTPRYLWKKIAGLKLKIIVVKISHIYFGKRALPASWRMHPAFANLIQNSLYSQYRNAKARW